MNIIQRVILVAGAIAFVLVLLTTPKYTVVQGQKISLEVAREVYKDIPVAMWNINAAAIRGAAVLGATVLLYFATGGIKATVHHVQFTKVKVYYLVGTILFVGGVFMFTYLPLIDFKIRAVGISILCLTFLSLFRKKRGARRS